MFGLTKCKIRKWSKMLILEMTNLFHFKIKFYHVTFTHKKPRDRVGASMDTTSTDAASMPLRRSAITSMALYVDGRYVDGRKK